MSLLFGAAGISIFFITTILLMSAFMISFVLTIKPVLSGYSKIDKTKILKINGSLMKVESIAECSLGAFCNTFDLH